MKILSKRGQRLLVTLGLSLFLLVPALPAAADGLRLVMFTRVGCMYCAKWEKEVGPVYDKTTEAEQAPLTRTDIRNPLPEGVTLARPVVFTPTFVLVAEDGAELSRLEGYPGADFFWGLLDEMLDRAPDS